MTWEDDNAGRIGMSHDADSIVKEYERELIKHTKCWNCRTFNPVTRSHCSGCGVVLEDHTD